MNTINYIRILFCLKIAFMIMFGSLINTFEKHMPTFIRQSFRYGKFAHKGKTSKLTINVPKKWFRHFYIYSSVLTSFTLGLTIKIYIYGSVPPPWLKNVLDEIGGYLREATVTHIHVVLALTLLTVQCVRRLYDTHFVSVFGNNSKMNLSHYIIGFIHYTGTVLAILVEAPVYAPAADSYGVDISDLKISDILATVLFLWACYHQYQSTVILGKLRKNSKGEIVNQKYELPKGDWFNYLSSPHSTAEILMYFSLTVILWNNITFFFIFLWVLSNQVETILLSHWWYQETFKEFPESRKAIIPFFY